MLRSLIRGLTVWILLVGLVTALPARADRLVVKRHVTLRAEPVRTSEAVAYPEIGSAFELLDDGKKVHGYYHVQDGSGHSGWIYYTYVDRLPDLAGGTPEALTPPSGEYMQVHYINVDQGAAALIEFPCAAIMIDAGGRTSADTAHILDYLKAFFARRTDLGGRLAAVFITHTHIDHDFSLKAVAEAYPIGAFVENGVERGSGRVPTKWMRSFVAASNPKIAYDPVSEADIDGAGQAGLMNATIDPVNCPAINPGIRILSGRYDTDPGWPEGEFENGNNQSLVIRIDFGKASFLFTGDMEEPALETLVDRWKGTQMLDADVWEVSHHGSYNGTTNAILGAVTPKLAIISMGRELPQGKWTAWDYGHPRRTALDLLVGGVSGTRPAVTVRVADQQHRFSDYALTKAIYATGWDGDVTIRADASGAIKALPAQ